ncbi:MAG: glycosyl transferase, family 2 [Fibrobacteres bacterium]|nr:glycosyl transferase, family 2 [Fibrobacterota bacterium]
MAVVLALAMAVPYLVLGRLGPTEAHVPGTLACLAIAFALYWFGCVENRFRLTEIQVLFLGILIRLCILPMPPSDDMHRFLWEGKIIGYGFNPFLLAPNDPAVAHLRDGNWALVNHPDLPTLYPPLAQAFFWLLAKLGSTQWPFKMGFLAFDVLGFFVLRSIARRRSAIASEAVEPLRIPAPTPRPARILAIYFLCPLLIFEIAGRGHFDSVPVFFNLLFLGSLLARKGWAPAALGLGAMTKISSLALAPLLLFALGWKRALAWGLGLAAAVGGSLWAVGAFTVLGKFATKFRFNAAMPSLLDSILPFLSGDARRNLSMALFAAVCLACLRLFRHAAPERQALWFMGLLLLFSPTLHPWYILWALPFVALTFSRPWLLLTGTVLITYEVYGRALATGHWHENPWLRLPEFLPPLSLFLWLKWKHHGTWLKGAVFSLKGRSGFPQEPSPKPLRKQEP